MRRTHDVAFLTVDSIQEGVGWSQVAVVTQELASLGLDIALMSFEKSKPSPERKATLQDANVAWTPLPFGAGGPRGSLDRIRRMTRRAPSAHLFHCRSDLPVATALLKRKQFVWDVRSLWADQRVASGTLSSRGPEFRVMRRLERAGYRSSSGMVTLTSSVLEVLEDRYGPRSKPGIVVPTCADLDTFTPSPPPSLETLEVLLSGTYNNYYDVSLMADFVTQLRARGTVRVTWARPGESSRADISFVDRTVVAGNAQELAGLIAKCHVGLSVCRADGGPSLTAAMPTKIAEFLACGRPVVVNPGLGDCDELVAAGVLAVATRASLNAEADSLLALLAAPDLADRCRRQAEERFSLKAGCLDLAALYAAIL